MSVDHLNGLMMVTMFAIGIRVGWNIKWLHERGRLPFQRRP